MGVHNKSGAKFTVNSFAKIIRNSKYMGVVISNGQTYNNIVPALVDEQTFKVCNAIMDNQRHKQKTVQDHNPYILSGNVVYANGHTKSKLELKQSNQCKSKVGTHYGISTFCQLKL